MRLRVLIPEVMLALGSNPLRAIITAAGIAIGVATTVSCVTILETLAAVVRDQFEGLGPNTLVVSRSIAKGPSTEASPSLEWEDLVFIRKKVPSVTLAAPLLPLLDAGLRQVHHGGATVTADVIATTADYAPIVGALAEVGRFLAPEDDLAGRPVAVLGASAAQNLRFTPGMVGQEVVIGETWVRVVGIMESRGQLFGLDQDNYVVVPYGFAVRTLGDGPQPSLNFMLKADQQASVQDLADQVTTALALRRGVPVGDLGFQVLTSTQLLDSVNRVGGYLRLGILGILGLTLLLAGVGVMNVMFVSIAERRREIGLLKALGARRGDLVRQFLGEALAICLAGGIAGVLVAMGLAALLRFIPGLEAAAVPLWSVILALGSALLIGVVFGTYPAARAADLEAVEALQSD